MLQGHLIYESVILNREPHPFPAQTLKVSTATEEQTDDRSQGRQSWNSQAYSIHESWHITQAKIFRQNLTQDNCLDRKDGNRHLLGAYFKSGPIQRIFPWDSFSPPSNLKEQ